MYNIDKYRWICRYSSKLRDYQQSAKEEIFSGWDIYDNIMIQMPTGTGKTMLFSSIIDDIVNAGDKKILIVAHRKELIEQIHLHLDSLYVMHGLFISSTTILEEYGDPDLWRDTSNQVIVASIQTLMHPANHYRAMSIHPDFIIIDEAHHSMAKTYAAMWDMFPSSKKLGVTATPWRMNHSGFRSLFDKLITSWSVKRFINEGWLSPYKYYSIKPNSYVDKRIRSINEYDIEGDYKNSSLEDAMDTDKIRSDLFYSYLDYAWGKKGIIYSICKKHSEHICELYRQHGVNIECIDSDTPKWLRNFYVENFRNGEIDIIVNVDIFSEGFDCPDVEFIQLARPTRSLTKYLQQVGRGLRKMANKECIILDNVGLYNRFGLPDARRMWQKHFDGEQYTKYAPVIKPNPFGSSNFLFNEGTEEMVLIQHSYSEYVEEETKDYEEPRRADNISNRTPIGTYPFSPNDLFFSPYDTNIRKPIAFNGKWDYYAFPSWDYTLDEISCDNDYHFDVVRRGHAEYMDPNEAIDLIQTLGYCYAKTIIWNTVGELVADESDLNFGEDDIEERMCSTIGIPMIKECAMENLYPLTNEQIEIVCLAPTTLGANCCIHAFEDGIRSYVSINGGEHESDDWINRYFDYEDGYYDNDDVADNNMDIVNNYPDLIVNRQYYEEEDAHDGIIIKEINYHNCSIPSPEQLEQNKKIIRTSYDPSTKIKSDYNWSTYFDYIKPNRSIYSNFYNDYDDEWLDKMIDKANHAKDFLKDIDLSEIDEQYIEEIEYENELLIDSNLKTENENSRENLTIYINQEDIINAEDSFVIFNEHITSVEMPGNAFVIENCVYVIEKRVNSIGVKILTINKDSSVKTPKSYIIYGKDDSDFFPFFDYDKLQYITDISIDTKGRYTITFLIDTDIYTFDISGTRII